MLNEVCFFKTGATGRLAGAAIHDGFILRKGSKVVLIGTETGIADADDPRAEAVMQVFPPAPVLLIELEPKGAKPPFFMDIWCTSMHSPRSRRIDDRPRHRAATPWLSRRAEKGC